MPTTYNGVGTSYFRKNNLTSRQGVCKSCNRTSTLSSYDTRLCFVVLFVPVFPLGRKHIVDQCSSCGQHFQMKLDQWEEQRQLAVSGALAAYEASATAETGTVAYREMVRFHQRDRAETLARELENRFPQDAKLHAFLGDMALDEYDIDSARLSFQKAYDLRPEMPEARIGQATVQRLDGKLDEARSLLDFMMKPGAGQLHDLSQVELLGDALARAGRHQQGLDLYLHLLNEFPAIGQAGNFRDKVKKLEKQVGIQSSSLPKRDMSLPGLMKSNARGWILAGGAVALFVVVMLGYNEWIRRHRTLTVVNVTGQPVEVSIDGGAPVVCSEELTELNLVEGKHVATIGGTTPETVDLEVSSSYFFRWIRRPVWLLNIGGQAIISSYTAIYDGVSSDDLTQKFHTGGPLLQFPDINYAFSQPPRSAKKNIKYHVLRLLSGNAAGAAEYLAGKQRVPEALDLLEAGLKMPGYGHSLPESYAEIANKSPFRQRARNFLAAGLDRRPVEVEWQRAWIISDESTEGRSAAAAFYENAVAKDPKNPDLLYLLGRSEPIVAKQRALHEKVIAMVPGHRWASYGIAYDLVAMGQWSEAAKVLEPALANEKFPERLHLLYWQALLNSGQAEKLDKELEKHVQNSPLDGQAILGRVQALLSLKKEDQADIVIAQAVEKMIAAESDHQQMVALGHCCKGNFNSMKSSVSSATEFGKRCSFWADIEDGLLEQSFKESQVEGDIFACTDLIGLATAVTMNRSTDSPNIPLTDIEKAAAAGYAASDEREPAQVASSMILASKPPSQEALETLILRPQLKAPLCAYLLVKHPSTRPWLATLTRNLLGESRLDFSWKLIRRAVESK
jgi:tetratricopeptide (TPR) repeat protein